MQTWTRLSLLLPVLLVGCEERHAGIDPHGQKICDLPVAYEAQLFEPDDAVYAELVWQDGNLRAFMDGNPEGILRSEEEICDFGKRFREHAEALAYVPRVLISADGSMPMIEMMPALRALATAGICYYHLHLKPIGGTQDPPQVRAALLNLAQPGCGESVEIFIIVVTNDDVVLDQTITKGVILDDADANIMLPGLDARCEKLAMGDGLILQAVFEKGASYQRFVDVLTCVNRHDGQFILTYTDDEIDGESWQVKPVEDDEAPIPTESR